MTSKSKALAPYVPGVPSVETIQAGTKRKAVTFSQMVHPYILEELKDDTSRKMAVSINGADAVYRGAGYDKAKFAFNVAARVEAAEGITIDPEDIPKIERTLQNILHGSGSSRSQRRAAARAMRDADTFDQ